jgi:hypothetical protein
MNEISSNKTCLVVAFYEGNREMCTSTQAQKYIYFQKQMLNKLEHNLSKVVFVISCDSTSEMNVQDENELITFIHRKNHGFSFGAWIEAIKYYKHLFDHYIFSEDDYIFTKHNFDTIMLHEYQQKQCDYMVTYLDSLGCMSTIGIISSRILSQKNYLQNIRFNNKKGDDMSAFLKQITHESISPMHNAFPYWGKENNKDVTIYLFGCNCDESQEQIQSRTLVSCIQLLNDELDFSWNQNMLVKHNNTWIIKQ